MARIASLTRSLSTAVTTVRPIVFGVVRRVTTLAPGRSRSTAPSTPETFTPSAGTAPAEPTASDAVPGPSPASIARNVAAPRPTAKQPATKPRSVPGAKLPVRRPNPST